MKSDQLHEMFTELLMSLKCVLEELDKGIPIDPEHDSGFIQEIRDTVAKAEGLLSAGA